VKFDDLGILGFPRKSNVVQLETSGFRIYEQIYGLLRKSTSERDSEVAQTLSYEGWLGPVYIGLVSPLYPSSFFINQPYHYYKY
jgi:hypothetical protein